MEAHESGRKRGHYLIAEAGQPRARRTGDAISVVVGVLLTLWAVFTLEHTEQFQAALAQFAKALPSWAEALLAMTYTLGLLLSILVAALLLKGRRWTALRDVGVTLVVTLGVALLLVDHYGALWPNMFPEISGGTGQTQFPVVRVAAVSGVLLVASPYLARPLRRVGWAVVLLVGLAAVAMDLGDPGASLGALGIGMASAGIVLVVFGSPKGYPDVADVRAGLRQLGVVIPDLHVAPEQSWGVRRYNGTTQEGVPVEVKAYGRDATDSQVVAKTWRSLTYRGGVGAVTLSRIQAVEHEALMTLLADRAGVAVPEILAAANADEEVAVLVGTRIGTRLTESGPDDVSDDHLVALWQDLARLHAAGMTHGGVSADAIRITGTGHRFDDLSAGSVVYLDTDAQLDMVHLLVALTDTVGADRAVDTAARGLGNDALAGVLPYLQPPALTKRERSATPKPAKTLKDLRGRIAELTGIEPPEPVKLRRLGPRDLIQIVILIAFVSALIPILAGVDYAELWSVLQNAAWWLVIVAMLLGQIVFIPQGFAMMYAVARPVPMRPLFILQSAIVFISFAIPGMAGRVTMESAFLYKFGVPPTVSVTKGALDTFSGFLVQVALILLALLTGSLSFSGNTTAQAPDVSWPIVIGVVTALAVATVLVVVKVPKVHDKVVPEVKKAWRALTEVLKSPRQAIGLFGNNLVVQLLWGAVLWIALLAMGAELNFLSCTFVVVATSLFQGIIPVPGGIGVSEAVMSAFLVPLGISSDVAMAATVVWRVATFYLPATEGFFTARWLEKHGYL